MTPDDNDVLAAELALGLIEGDDRIVALERLLAEPAFAADVALWRDRIGALALVSEAAPPRPHVLERIEARLSDTSHPTVTRKWPWLTMGAGLGAIAASLAALFLMPAPRIVRIPVEQPAAPPLVAVLTPAEGETRPAVAAVLDRRTRTLRLTATIVVPGNRAAELWRIGTDGVPHPLGLLEGEFVRVAADKAPEPDETIAVSIEPLGGSPSNLPTGPVIASGSLVAI